VLAVVLAVLSFFVLSALCSAEGHASVGVGHEHVTGSAHSHIPTHDANPAPSDHCHHDSAPVHREAALDRALHRPGDTGRDAQTSSHDAPVRFSNVTVPSGLDTAFWSRASGPLLPGCLLLVLLSVARN